MQGWVLFEAMLVKGNSFFYFGINEEIHFFPLFEQKRLKAAEAESKLKQVYIPT